MVEADIMLKTRQPSKNYYSQAEVKPVQQVDTAPIRQTRLGEFEAQQQAPWVPQDKPCFVKHLQNVSANKGDRAIMQCMLKPSPDTDIQWYRNNMPIKQSTDYGMNYDRNSGLATLNVSEAHPEDSGQYTCVARSPHGEESSTGWLVVKGK
jgi:hypothetical protein